eukprot:TRINITY_DN15060_c0_g1::TRINITY_DN15060_c0_g1_i1::g.25035::m.25035 TRINITY_DN15060_c0_g1::TRINITY_DN15060_c0_g1_i1::g.25035  ORF type:complete len:107 (+),score=-1.86,sp/B0RB33/RS12_CLAMS/53.15/2e-31,Ribosom_S12_S23/PF00164.20/2e-28 TRINITY_DN15060_c0_g1_i1:68-388(+)
MPSFQQLIRNCRWEKPSRLLDFLPRPQFSGICLSVYTMAPKKPNSANRKVARVKLSNGRVILAKIPGEGHPLHQHSKVLLQHKRTIDLPGCHFQIIRGALDFKNKK